MREVGDFVSFCFFPRLVFNFISRVTGAVPCCAFSFVHIKIRKYVPYLGYVCAYGMRPSDCFPGWSIYMELLAFASHVFAPNCFLDRMFPFFLA